MIEPIEPAHADCLFGGLSDSRLYEFIDATPPVNVDRLRRRYEDWSFRRQEEGGELWLNWAIRRTERDQYVGVLQATVDAKATATIAYVLFRSEWGKGYAREAVGLMIETLIREHGVSRLRATVDPSNERSISLLFALGFQRHESSAEELDTRLGEPGDLVFARPAIVPVVDSQGA